MLLDFCFIRAAYSCLNNDVSVRGVSECLNTSVQCGRKYVTLDFSVSNLFYWKFYLDTSSSLTSLLFAQYRYHSIKTSVK